MGSIPTTAKCLCDEHKYYPVLSIIFISYQVSTHNISNRLWLVWDVCNVTPDVYVNVRLLGSTRLVIQKNITVQDNGISE